MRPGGMVSRGRKNVYHVARNSHRGAPSTKWEKLPIIILGPGINTHLPWDSEEKSAWLTMPTLPRIRSTLTGLEVKSLAMSWQRVRMSCWHVPAAAVLVPRPPSPVQHMPGAARALRCPRSSSALGIGMTCADVDRHQGKAMAMWLMRHQNKQRRPPCVGISIWKLMGHGQNARLAKSC